MIRRSVECWVIGPGRRILLLLVPERPGWHGAFWQPITGGIEAGESARRAAVREVTEETGVRLTAEDLVAVATGVVVEVAVDLRIDKTLFAARTGHDRVALSDEHVGYRWVPAEDVAGGLYWDSNRRTWDMVTRAAGPADAT